jgi:type II secretory pathway pseudopilin PulG
MTMTWWRRRLNAEGGFSLVEMVVSMTVAALMLTSAAYVLGSSTRTIVSARANSQAAELISEALEQLRATSYAAVAMNPSDLATDSRITGSPGSQTFDPDADGAKYGPEAVLAVTGGAVSPHISTLTRNDQTYTLARYVTTPPLDTEVGTAAYKRVTVIATWTTGGMTHTRQASTFLTLTRRGLPLPNFQSTATLGSRSTAPITVNAGAPLTLPFNMVNRGARDAFNLTIASTPTLSMPFDFYDDVDGSATKSDPDAAAADSDANGVPDTGMLEPDEAWPMLAYGSVPTNAVAGTYVVTVSAASIGQPSADGATRNINFYVKVVNQSSCTGCTYRALYLRNEYPSCGATVCNSLQKTNMPMRTDSSTVSTLGNYDTNVDSVGGRNLARSSTTPTSDAAGGSTVANWRYTVPSATTVNGDVLVDLYLAPSGSGSTPATLVPLTVKAYLLKSTNGSGDTTLVGSATGTLAASSSTAYRSLRVTIPGVSTTVANNRFLEVKVVVESASSTTGAWLAYDATPYPSVVWVPVV